MIFSMKNILSIKLIILVEVVCIGLSESSSLAELIKENSAFTAKTSNNNHYKNDIPSSDYDLNSDSLLDTSVFGNTYETFFEFANRRTFEIESRNKDLYEKSMQACIYTPYENESEQQAEHFHQQQQFDDGERKQESTNPQCLVSVLNMAEHHSGGGKMSDRLFQFDGKTLGLVSSSDSSLRLFDFNTTHGVLQSVRVKYFKSERPFDACADTVNSNIYIVFPDENKIGKYHVSQGVVVFKSLHNARNLNRTRVAIKELISIKDVDFNPTSIACHDSHVYVSQKHENQVRVYDRNLRLSRIISLSGIVTSPHHALAVNENARVLLDGMDSVGLFDTAHASLKGGLNKKYNLMNSNNNQEDTQTGANGSPITKTNICHFYTNKNCLEDIHLQNKSETTNVNGKTHIFIADSCDNDVKMFLFAKDERMQLLKRFRVPLGKPVSMATLSSTISEHLLVLTHSPRKIYVFDMKSCK